MRKFLIFLILLVVSYKQAIAQRSIKKPVQYVDPFIGTENSGNTFPGPCLPFGMVRVSPDFKVKNGKWPNTNSGYSKNGIFYGFSHTHVSGTGGGAKYGNILMMPTTGVLDILLHESSLKDEVAMAGYYKVWLSTYNIKAELTTTHSVALHCYTFPKSAQSNIIIDAASFLIKGTTVQKLVQSGVRVLSPTEIEGFATIKGGWNEGGPYSVYFFAKFDTPGTAVHTWRNNHLDTLWDAMPKNEQDSFPSGAAFSYQTVKDQQIHVKVGISLVSMEKAKENIKNEVGSRKFNQIAHEGATLWNKLLSRIQVVGTETHKQMFYTALYHVLLMPSNRTGENPLWKSKEPYYDDYYAIWDTYRTSNPLITLIDPKREEDIVRSLIDIYDHEGYMPDARSGNYNGLIQGGTNSDMLIADAWVKGLKHIDYEKAYQAMKKNAETLPLKPKKEGRAAINQFNQLGYVPYGVSIAGTRTLEYSLNDAAVATIAKGLGRRDDYVRYKERASNWLYLWHYVSNHGATGFIWPKGIGGSWERNFDYFRSGSFKDFLYEGNTWTYSLFVPQDVKKLIAVCGGRAAFVNRLDTFFLKNYYNVNNEPGFFTPFLYTYAGRPDKTSWIIDRIRSKHFNSTAAGLPGNDDSGAMSGWFVFNAIGLYPNTGQDIYLITTPLFKQTSIHLATNKEFIIKAKNLSNTNIYIQSATLNGQLWEKAWLKHGDLTKGGCLELIMGDRPSHWGVNNPPPSLSDTR